MFITAKVYKVFYEPCFLGATSTSFVHFNGLISRGKKYEVNGGEPENNSQRQEGNEDLSYRGFSNFDEIALTNPSDQQNHLG